MPSFRSPEKQAKHAIGKASAIGQARHHNRENGKIHSYGTARNYEQALRGFAAWRFTRGYRGTIMQATTAEAKAYLAERAGQVSQKTIDLDRQAMAILPNVDAQELGHPVAEVDSRSGLADTPRAYTDEQVALIVEGQSPQHALATELAAAAGLRAHELLTLRPADEQPASTHRDWHPDRFHGRDNAVRYTVVGKGGLIREVAIPRELALRLEAVRLEEPRTVTDRSIKYQQHYDIGGGQRWSQNFSQHSSQEFGWSTGAHGVRHGYAQDRLEELQLAGYTYSEAKEIISQELGHFREDVTNAYLR